MKTKNKFTIEEERFGIPMHKKNKHKVLKTILLTAVCFLIIALIAISVEKALQISLDCISVNDDLNSAWLSSVASYWGGIIGGVISGTLSVIGVFFTIRYYKNSEAKKDRVEHLPFLELNILSKKRIKGIDLTKAYYIEGTKNRKNNDSTLFLFDVQIENIGSGFAKTLVLQNNENIGGIVYNRLLKVNETTELQIKAYSNDIVEEGLTFGIVYIDCMSNEYQQFYTIKHGKEYYIESGYPIFLCQAHDIAEK